MADNPNVLDPAGDDELNKIRLNQLLYDRSLYGKRGESLPDPYPPNTEIRRLRKSLRGSENINDEQMRPEEVAANPVLQVDPLTSGLQNSLSEWTYDEHGNLVRTNTGHGIKSTIVGRSYGDRPDFGKQIGEAYRSGSTIKQIMEQFGLTKGQAVGHVNRNVDPSAKRPINSNSPGNPNPVNPNPPGSFRGSSLEQHPYWGLFSPIDVPEMKLPGQQMAGEKESENASDTQLAGDVVPFPGYPGDEMARRLRILDLKDQIIKDNPNASTDSSNKAFDDYFGGPAKILPMGPG